LPYIHSLTPFDEMFHLSLLDEYERSKLLFLTELEYQYNQQVLLSLYYHYTVTVSYDNVYYSIECDDTVHITVIHHIL
jgi:hypothetical protein